CYCAAIEYGHYRDEYRTILENMSGVHDITEEELTVALAKEVERYGEKLSYSFEFVTEKTEKKIENFVKRERLSDNEIEKLDHPIWLPVSFNITDDYKPGDTFTIILDGIHHDFQIAGFYESGLMTVSGHGYKCVVSDRDYTVLGMLLNDRGDGKYTALYFNCDDKFNFADYFHKCSESSHENIVSYTEHFGVNSEKDAVLQFLNIYLYFIAFFAAITMVSALFVITHRISDDISDQMQQIGVLEALGYRAREISLSYVGEYLICGGIGSVLGGIIALLTDPVINIGVQKMMGRMLNGSVDIIGLILAVVFVAALVIVIALIKAVKVKKYPPVVALRKGIETHHFGRNILPLEKSNGGINLALAIKSFIGDMKSSLGVALCVFVSGVAILACMNCAYFFKDGINGLISLTGMDITVDVELMKGVDANAVRDEIAGMPEVRKVIVSYAGGLIDSVPIKGSDNRAAVQVYEDYRDSENIYLIRGRFPEHDNEVMITVARCREEGLDIGDSIILEGNGIENKYIITGVTSSMVYNGMSIYLTTEGYLRTEFNARASGLSVYLADGVSQETFEQRLYEMYGKNAKDSINAQITGDTLEERIRAAADQKLATLLSYYGVTNADYAVVVGDKLITGNSRGFLIQEVSSLMSLAKQQMGPIASVTQIAMPTLAIIIAVVVAVMLWLIVSMEVKRQRKSLGIMKALGYSSKDLKKQIALKTMPVTIVSVIIAAVLTKFVYSWFWMTMFDVIENISVPVTIAMSAVIVMFCYAVTYICAGKVKKISVTELMTE
ncbi:MAG: ABC transporter permease, partial [Ruminiclostridium sp.]|nr:ABC transporter permease [Ruminiclostridium sp.]